MEKNKKKIPLNSVGKIIQEGRKKKELSENDLACKINNSEVNEKIIKEWEKGIKFPDLNMIYKLSEILDLNPNELLNIKNIIQKQSRKEINWAARRIGDRILGWVKPGYKFASFISKIVLAIILVMVYKYIHILYEATDNPTVLQTQEILGEYLNEDINNNLVENNINE